MKNHYSYLKSVVNNLIDLIKVDAHAIKRIGQYSQIYLQLALLDLEPIRDDLESCYSPYHPGKESYDAVAMFRTYLIMAERNWPHISTWPNELKGHPELQILSGFKVGQYPKRTSLRDFADRLRDGPYALRKLCPECHPELQEIRTTGQTFLRNLKKAKKMAESALQARKLSPSEKRSQQAAREAKAAIEKGKMPQDFATRMNELLMKCVLANLRKMACWEISKGSSSPVIPVLLKVKLTREAIRLAIVFLKALISAIATVATQIPMPIGAMTQPTRSTSLASELTLLPFTTIIMIYPSISLSKPLIFPM